MERADLKRMLRLARKDPIHAAFALGGDGKAIVVMDKRKQPRALEKGIKDKAPDAKNSRWGTVSIDPDEPKIARFVINKAASGIARKLVIALKGTGCSKVEIVLEDGTSVESCEGEPEDDQDQEDETSAAGEDDPADDSNADGEPAAAPTSGSDAAPDSDQPDAGTLADTLTALVKRMMDVIANDPSQKSALAELATDAQASLKRGDLAQAAASIDVLQKAIDAASGGTSTGDDAAGDQDRADGSATATADAVDPDDTMSQDPASAGDSNPQPQAGSSPNPAAPDGTAQSGTGQDAAGLIATLTSVVKQLMPLVAADPSQRDALKGIVTQAQSSLKSGDLQTASGHVDSLRAMLDAGGTQTGAANPPAPAAQDTAAKPASPQIAKARTAWVATRQKVENDLGGLHDAFSSAFKGHDKEADVVKAFRSRVDTVLDTLDEKLSHKLDELNNAADPSQRTKLVQEAQRILGDYQKHVASDQTIAALDNNPFVPLSIQKTMNATIAALSKAIR
jgi:hypothetical protein